MKRIILYIAVITGINVSCTDSGQFSIKGTISNGNNQTLYLKEMTTTGLISIDSASLKQDGAFVLKGKKVLPSFYMLYLKKENSITLIIHPGDKITINSDGSDLLNSYTVEGSKESSLIQELMIKQTESFNKVKELGKIYEDSSHSKNILKIKANLDSTYLTIETSHRNYTKKFINDNTGTFASLMALYQYLGPRNPVLHIKNDFIYYTKVDSILYKLYPEVESVKSLHTFLTDYKEQNSAHENTEKALSIGALAPIFALPTPKGDTISLTSLRGKFVLVDFWASWCGPCRAENPTLVAAYRKFKRYNFEILQVSLDKSMEAWTKAIADDNLTWLHVSDLKYWNSLVVPLYSIEGIPFNVLLDKEGKIIAKNLRGAMLEETLTEVFIK